MALVSSFSSPVMSVTDTFVPACKGLVSTAGSFDTTEGGIGTKGGGMSDLSGGR